VKQADNKTRRLGDKEVEGQRFPIQIEMISNCKTAKNFIETTQLHYTTHKMTLTTIPMKTTELISPYGGELVNLVVPEQDIVRVKNYAGKLPSIQISERIACDLELLATGGFSPLDRFPECPGQHETGQWRPFPDSHHLAGGTGS